LAAVILSNSAQNNFENLCFYAKENCCNFKNNFNKNRQLMKYLFYFHLTSRLNEFIINADSRTDAVKGRVNPAELKSSQNGFNRVSGNG
jgi:hypothetical protein